MVPVFEGQIKRTCSLTLFLLVQLLSDNYYCCCCSTRQEHLPEP